MPDLFFQSDAGDTLRPGTVKKRATADLIHADLTERIEQLAAREPKFSGCAVAWPKPLPVRRDGAPNWTVDGFTELQPGCFTALVKFIDQVRLERVEPESLGLFCPGLADELVRCEPPEGLEPASEVVGADEVARWASSCWWLS